MVRQVVMLSGAGASEAQLRLSRSIPLASSLPAKGFFAIEPLRTTREAMFTCHRIRPGMLGSMPAWEGVSMETQDAVTILRALANGTDPETGTRLEEGSTCRRPRTVIALNRAVSALAQEEEREKSKPSNAFRRWTRDEDAQVCEEIRTGMDFREIAKTHNRTLASILARLVKLGKINSTPPPQAA